MRRVGLWLALSFLALPLAAEQITVDKIIAAHQFGAPPEAIIAQINDPANTVAPLEAADLARLQAAGVPEAVVNALVARAPKPTPPAQPDNPALVDLVRLVKSGLSEKIIADQIRQGGVDQKPTVNDLIYLKENGIQEVIIVALMEAPLKKDVVVPARPGAAAAGSSGEVVFEGLVFRHGGVFRKNPTGKLVLSGDKLAWRDASDASRNFELFLKGVKQITVTCVARESGNFCYQLTFDFTKGDDYEFEDAQKDVGGNENLMRLLDVLKQRYPALPIIEKTKKG